jgi:hypothetical protein
MRAVGGVFRLRDPLLEDVPGCRGVQLERTADQMLGIM